MVGLGWARGTGSVEFEHAWENVQVIVKEGTLTGYRRKHIGD